MDLDSKNKNYVTKDKLEGLNNELNEVKQSFD